MKRNCFFLFKSAGGYIGLLVGFILSLQIKMNRIFLLEGGRDFDCYWGSKSGFSCSNLALSIIILFLILGFIAGGLIQKKINK
jgi:hypothetical protein